MIIVYLAHWPWMVALVPLGGIVGFAIGGYFVRRRLAHEPGWFEFALDLGLLTLLRYALTRNWKICSLVLHRHRRH